MLLREPMWLWVIALAVPLGYFGWRWFTSMTPLRRASALVLRTVLLTLVGLMLAGAHGTRQTDRLAVIGVVDVSDSVRRFATGGENGDPFGRQRGSGMPWDATELARQFFAIAGEDRGPNDLMGLVVFDGRSVAIAVPSRADTSGRSLDVRLADGTDIAGALRYAAAMVPNDATGRLVLISDGNQTTGDARAAAAELAQLRGGGTESTAASGLTIDVVPLDYVVRDETIVERVDLPPSAPALSTIPVRIVLRAASPSVGTLRLTRGGEPIDLSPGEPGDGRRISVPAGRSVQIVEVALPPGRIHAFDAIYEPDAVRGGSGAPGGFSGDTALDNNRAEGFTITPGKGSVLMVEAADGAGTGGPLREALEAAGISVETINGPGLSTDLLALQAYDLIILNSVPAEDVSPTAQQTLSAFVRQTGGGLVMVGGPNSFGAGGWKGSEIEDLLPVHLDLPEELVVPEAAVVFVLDQSGSMGATIMGSAQSQQAIANDAAALAVRSLDPGDEVGIIAFSSGVDVIQPLGPNTDAELTAAAIRGIASGGGTNLPPALIEAGRQLDRSDARAKHIIVLSDGKSQSSERLPALAAELRLRGIRVTAIAVGDDADDFRMREMAQQGDGAFYGVINPQVLPRIFLKAVRIVRSPLIREQPFMPEITDPGSAMLAGFERFPRLWGLVLTQPRTDPNAVTAIATPDGEPVLAHWQAELGQVVAFTSDADTWAREWQAWDGFAPFWVQLVRNASRAETNTNAELSVDADEDRMRIRITAADDEGRPLDLLSIPITIYGPSGQPREHRLTQTGPGEYAGEIPTGEPGNHVVVARPSLAGRSLAPLLGGTSVYSGAEYRALASNRALLEQLAQTTGGRVLAIDNPEAADLFNRDGLVPTRATLPLWPALLVATLAVFLLDVGTRRIAWDRLLDDAIAARGSVRPAATGEAIRSLAGVRERLTRTSGATAMGDEDAAEIVREQHARRLRERRERVTGAIPTPSTLPPTDRQAKASSDIRDATTQPPRKARIERDDSPQESGLLAAKRRANDRFRE